MTGELVDLHSPLPADLRRSIAALSGMPELATQDAPLDVFRFYESEESKLSEREPELETETYDGSDD